MTRRHLPSGPSTTRVNTAIRTRKGRLLRHVPRSTTIVPLYVRKGRLSSPTLSSCISGLAITNADRVILIVNNSCNLSSDIGDHTILHLSVSPVAFPRRLTQMVILRRVCHTFRVHDNKGCRGWYGGGRKTVDVLGAAPTIFTMKGSCRVVIPIANYSLF